MEPRIIFRAPRLETRADSVTIAADAHALPDAQRDIGEIRMLVGAPFGRPSTTAGELTAAIREAAERHRRKD